MKKDDTTVVTGNEDTPKKTGKLPKPVKWLILIVGTIVGALAITTLITLPYLKGDLYVTNEGTKKSHDNDDFEVDDRWEESDSSCCGIECKSYYNPHPNTEIEEEISYLKFSGKKKAKKAFDLLKENCYYNIEEEGDNYFVGWLEGVCDASIKEIVCLDGDVIVSSEIYIASEWATSEDDTDPRAWNYPERKQYVMDHYVK